MHLRHELCGLRVEQNAPQRSAARWRRPRIAHRCGVESGAAQLWRYFFCFLCGDDSRSLNCVFNFVISSRSAATSFCTEADPGSSFGSAAWAGVDASGAEKGTHGGRKLAADEAAAGRKEVK